MMKQIPIYKLAYLIIASLVITIASSSTSFAAEKDKAARRAALMMQKMKQDMETEKAAMQTQFDAQKKELEEKLKGKDEELAIVDKKLATAERKNKALESEIKKVTLEKEAVDAKLLQTQTSLDELKTQYQQAQADLKFNDNQRKTLSTNLAQTTKSVNECEAKNAKLHQFGTELIQIYDNPNSYEAAMRNEKFLQLKRVELENILQSKQDNLDDARFVNKKTAY
jgi:chromosome segregation ATPase